MARTYNARRTLADHKASASFTLPHDARRERKAARQALRQMAHNIGTSATVWQFRDTPSTENPSTGGNRPMAPGLQR